MKQFEDEVGYTFSSSHLNTYSVSPSIKVKVEHFLLCYHFHPKIRTDVLIITLFSTIYHGKGYLQYL